MNPSIAVVADTYREGPGVAFLPLFVVPDKRGLIFKRVRDADLEWPLGIAVPSLRAPRCGGAGPSRAHRCPSRLDRNGPMNAFRP